jgi:hypothetical protein
MSTLSSQAVDTGRHGRQLPPVCLDSGVDTGRHGRQLPSAPDTSVVGADWAPRVRYVTEAADARQKLAKLLEEPVLGVDIETTGLDPHQDRIRLLSVAARDGRVAVFDLWALPPELLHPLSQGSVGGLQRRFRVPVSDAGRFSIPRCTTCNCWIDSCRTRGDRKLANVAEEVLGLSLSKEQQTSDWAAPQLSDAQIAYAGLDAAVTVRLAEMLLPKVPRRLVRRVARGGAGPGGSRVAGHDLRLRRARSPGGGVGEGTGPLAGGVAPASGAGCEPEIGAAAGRVAGAIAAEKSSRAGSERRRGS